MTVEELRLKRLAIQVQGGSVANILAPEDRPALRSPIYLAPADPGNTSKPPNFTGNRSGPGTWGLGNEPAPAVVSEYVRDSLGKGTHGYDQVQRRGGADRGRAG